MMHTIRQNFLVTNAMHFIRNMGAVRRYRLSPPVPGIQAEPSAAKRQNLIVPPGQRQVLLVS